MKYKKVILLVFVGFIVAGSLLGCGTDKSQLPTERPREDYQDYEDGYDVTVLEPFEMEKVGYSTNYSFDFFRCPVTDVLYIYRANGNDGGFSVMWDPETGLPLTYTRYMELYDNLDSLLMP